jgi:hypothetical protein
MWKSRAEAQVGNPVPAEHAFDADDDAIAKGSDGVQESLGVARKVAVEDDVAVVIEDAKIHAPCMQIDPAIKSMGLAIVTHG